MKHVDCCETSFLVDSGYLPLYSQPCKSELIDCPHACTVDGIACQSDWYAVFEMHVGAEHDGKLLKDKPSGFGKMFGSDCNADGQNRLPCMSSIFREAFHSEAISDVTEDAQLHSVRELDD